MVDIKRILIATDGSEHTKKAVDYGIAIAKSTKAKLHAIYVVDTSAFASIPMDTAWESMYELLRQEGDEATRYVADIAKTKGIDVERDTIEGHPADEIIKYAKNNSVDLIVMGTLGKKQVWTGFFWVVLLKRWCATQKYLFL